MPLKPIQLPACRIHIYEQKHTGGHVVDEHHHQIHQLLFVLEGEGRMRLNGEWRRLSAYDTALIVPYAEHAVMSDSKLTLLVLAFDADVLDPELRAGLLGKHFPNSEAVPLNVFAGGELRRLLRKMLFAESQQTDLDLLSLKIDLSEILLLLARSKSAAPAVTDSNRLRAERIRHFIDTHYFEPLSAADLAGRLGISSRYVNTIFKEQYNITPTQYLTEVRIERARTLLAETDKDIISICFEVGYDSVSSFYRAFKASTGASPNHFRKLHRSETYNLSEFEKNVP